MSGTMNNNDRLIANLAEVARRAARSLRHAPYSARQAVLLSIADAIQSRESEILAANKVDVERER